MDLRHHEKYLSSIDKLQGKKLPEQKLAINRDLEPTGYFDDDVYCRAVIDFVLLRDESALIVDWKFGKRKEGFDQLDLSAAVLSCYEPQVKIFKVMFYWAKEKKFVPKTITHTDLPGIWSGFIKRATTMENDREYKPTQNFLCKQHCPVTTCKFNGNYRPI